jgi:hypothetical protein
MDPKKNFIKTLWIALGIIVILFGAIWYVKADIDGKFLAIQQLRAELQPKESSLGELAKMQSDAEKARQYAPQLDQLFTTKYQLLLFSADIGFLAKQAGFEGIPRFKEEVAAPATDLQKTNFSLLLEGPKNFDDLTNFFRMVEKSKYFVRFNGLNISQEGALLRVGADGYVISFQ